MDRSYLTDATLAIAGEHCGAAFCPAVGAPLLPDASPIRWCVAKPPTTFEPPAEEVLLR
jgi:hypothetical protein